MDEPKSVAKRCHTCIFSKASARAGLSMSTCSKTNTFPNPETCLQIKERIWEYKYLHWTPIHKFEFIEEQEMQI